MVFRFPEGLSCLSLVFLDQRRQGGPGLSLAVVRDLRVARAPVTAEDLAALQTDVLAGFVLARAAAGLSGRDDHL
jgi:hypothetical protein